MSAAIDRPHGRAPDGFRPAGFWQRAAAWSLDAALLTPPAVLLSWPLLAPRLQLLQARAHALMRTAGEAMAAAIVDGTPLLQLPFDLQHHPSLLQASAALQRALGAAAWPPLLVFVLLGAVWHVAFECSRSQATPGQRWLGLRALDREGRRLRAGRALGRHLAGALSWLTLNIGHLMATAAPRHLALHDRVSGTRMIAADAGPPRWAWAWLALWLAASVALAVWLAQRGSVLMTAALEGALYPL